MRSPSRPLAPDPEALNPSASEERARPRGSTVYRNNNDLTNRNNNVGFRCLNTVEQPALQGIRLGATVPPSVAAKLVAATGKRAGWPLTRAEGETDDGGHAEQDVET